MIIKDAEWILPPAITCQTVPELDLDWNRSKNSRLLLKIINFSQVVSLDSAGIAWLNICIEELIKENVAPALVAISPEHGLLLKTLSPPQEHKSPILMGNRQRWVEQIGESAQQFSSRAYQFVSLTADIFYWSILALIGKKQHRAGATIDQSVTIGVNALPVIGSMSFLVGLILALQSAAQLRQFGANLFIADLIGVAMIREMGPLMTAIMLAGRSGSAIAAEIATMGVTEELDALRMMAIHPIRFVIVPKFIAISLMTPLLTILADFLGIVGGLLIAIWYLELPFNIYWERLFQTVLLYDVVIGLFKSLIFAWIILVVGAFYGLHVKGGAEGVGKATTAAVVLAIFLVIVADSLFSLLFYFGD